MRRDPHHSGVDFHALAQAVTAHCRANRLPDWQPIKVLGGWGVDETSYYGDSAAIVATFPTQGEAVAFAALCDCLVGRSPC